jgi:hypothetical protein
MKALPGRFVSGKRPEFWSSVVSLAVIFGAAGTVDAGSYTPFVSGNVWPCLGAISGLNCTAGGNQNAFGPEQVSMTYFAGSNSLTASASGTPGYGLYKTYASASFSITGTPVVAFVRGGAESVDDVTISDPALNGQQGLLYISYSVDGTITQSGAANGFLDVGFGAGQNLYPPDQSDVRTFTSSVSGVFSLPSPFTFIYGQPFGFTVFVDAFAGTATPDGTGVNFDATATGTEAATVDFGHTFDITSFVPADANGQPVYGALISSASGTSYVSTPEPSSGLLLGSVLMVGAVYLRRGRGNHY